jgi:hypothetical protein
MSMGKLKLDIKPLYDQFIKEHPNIKSDNIGVLVEHSPDGSYVCKSHRFLSRT